MASDCSRKLQSSCPPTPTGLRREDIERIVQRAEQHYSGIIAELKAENDLLRKQVASGRPGIDTDLLRQQLVEERRQRLACEEQCQRVNEEHAKVVATLEMRIKKLERVCQDASAKIPATPRSARFSFGTPLRESEPEPAKVEVRKPEIVADALPSVVSDFLLSIGKELDEINAAEAARSAQLKSLV